MRQKTRNLQETSEANGLWGLSSIYYWGNPPGKRRPRNLHGTPPSNLKNCGKKLEICKKPLRPMAYEVSFPSIIGGTPPGKRGPRNLHGTPPSNLKKCDKKSKFAINHWDQWLIRSLFHLLLGGPSKFGMVDFIYFMWGDPLINVNHKVLCPHSHFSAAKFSYISMIIW